MSATGQKYHIITFGCQMNFSDSERISTVLRECGFQEASDIREADLIVVNMCSIRQSAVDRVFGLIPKFQKLKQKREVKTILTGCILEKDRNKFLNSFDYILDKENIPLWSKVLTGKESYYDKKDFFNIEPLNHHHPSAMVPISTGCNFHCTYCVVPFTRGPEIDRKFNDILEEVKSLAHEGYREIWLLGQIVDSYRDGRLRFSDLLKEVEKIPGDFWIRFTSPHPSLFSNDLIKVMADSSKITPYINLPVQSGNNQILKKMGRFYTVKHYKSLVKKIRENIPGICISTDIIVGFPGETEEQFNDTAKLLREVEFDMAYIARFSPRPGTPAAKMEDNISDGEKKHREKRLTHILQETGLKNNEKFVGEVVKVLPLREKGGFLLGKSFHYKTVKFKGDQNLIGNFQNVKITGASSFGLQGEIVNNKKI